MREVTRLGDRVKIKWGLIDNLGIRLAIAWVDSTLAALNWSKHEPDMREAIKTQPVVDVRGRWIIQCFVKDAATFSTPSKELEIGDFSRMGLSVAWKEPDGGYRSEPLANVDIIEENGQVVTVKRRTER